MPIPLTCDCGRTLRIKDELAGRKVRCPACAGVLTIPEPAARAELDDDALKVLLDDPPDVDPPSRPMSVAARLAEEPETLRPKPARASSSPSARPMPAEKQKRRRAVRESNDDRPRKALAINPEIITGMFMMLGAVVWFFLGLSAGFIYFYPPVLFILGIGAIVRGCTGRE